MRLKVQRQDAQAREEADFMSSLSAREAELRRLEQAHRAAIKAHNSKLKYASSFQLTHFKSLMFCLSAACTCTFTPRLVKACHSQQTCTSACVLAACQYI